jgi:hypothetical protein
MKGARCRECGNYTVIRKDGCDFCSACGWTGHLRLRKDKRIDAYIAKSQDFAKPILEELRARVHALMPEIEEDIKWGFPSFMYKGKIFFGMSAFKAHAGCGFWHPLMRPDDKSPEGISEWRVKCAGPAAVARRVREAREEGEEAHRRWRTGPPAPKPDPNRKVAVPEGPRRAAREEREGARDVRGLSLFEEERVRDLDQRGEARGNARQSASTRRLRSWPKANP